MNKERVSYAQWKDIILLIQNMQSTLIFDNPNRKSELTSLESIQLQICRSSRRLWDWYTGVTFENLKINELRLYLG